MRRHLGAVFLACAMAAACATPDTQLPDTDASDTSAAAEQQRRFVLTSRLDTQKRVHNVAYRVLSANADLCGEDVSPVLGLQSMQIDAVARDYRGSAQGLWRLDERPRVMHVVPDSAAARAGVQAGDVLISLNGRAIGGGRDAGKRYTQALGEMRPGAPARLTVERTGRQQRFSLQPATVCAYPVLVNHDSSANAFTDGERIVVNDGILKIAKSDEELALVIGHELAHITKGHIDKQTQNAILAGAGGLAIDIAFAAFGMNTQGAFTEFSVNAGRRAFSQGFEKEADYVGIYHMARAGYDTTGVERFWRAMAAEDPASITFAGTHPTSTERYALITKTHQEVAGKRAAGQPLTPNVKPRDRKLSAKRRPAEETR
jgi:membrane-associated protease RseP (regulator of RpoE activity)